MSDVNQARIRIKRSINAIDDATTTLQRIRTRVNEGRSDIDKALRELDDAESYLRRAIKDLPED